MTARPGMYRSYSELFKRTWWIVPPSIGMGYCLWVTFDVFVDVIAEIIL